MIYGYQEQVKENDTNPKLKALPPTMEVFEKIVKPAHLQTCIWKAV